VGNSVALALRGKRRGWF